ncbi:hypothetical protein NLX67_00625 [Domibacillus sp. A3M-37]|uniref:immunoglobulin-like domain-containing protein n=1 Tax=Domibacillus sp. A3M-37 TaxID=2962037 RepID=UPI0020B7E0E6|nr:immunoglobulin-like domain-containing protein [Domibacillus sp. A3M-37]MCP3760899.1 hypothetical protein [Domibacillus sp. A3M-37]
MRKGIVQLAASLLLLSGCQSEEPAPKSPEEQTAPIQDLSNEQNGLSMTVKNVSGNGLTLVIQNGRNAEFTYGRSFLIEQKIGKTWYMVPFKENMNIFEDIGLLASPRKQTVETVDLGRLEGLLSSGSYRIVKSFSEFSINEKGAGVHSDEFQLAAPFEIKD